MMLIDILLGVLILVSLGCAWTLGRDRWAAHQEAREERKEIDQARLRAAVRAAIEAQLARDSLGRAFRER